MTWLVRPCEIEDAEKPGHGSGLWRLIARPLSGLERQARRCCHHKHESAAAAAACPEAQAQARAITGAAFGSED